MPPVGTHAQLLPRYRGTEVGLRARTQPRRRRLGGNLQVVARAWEALTPGELHTVAEFLAARLADW